jgi:hypothetical protein
MSPTLRTAAIAIALTATGVAGCGDGGKNSSAKVVTVIEHAITNHTTDIDKPGDSPGDVLTYANPVFDAGDKAKAGSDLGWCIRVEVGKSYDCAWTTILKDGQLMVQGPFLDSGVSKIAITGGTGAYAGAHGWMLLKSLAGGKKYLFEFHILG